MIGIVVLVLGIGSAGFVYWAETRSPDLRDDLSMVGYDRAQVRQIGQLFGKSGVMTDKLLGDLKSPGAHAAIIVGVSALIAFGCFRYERHLDDDSGAG